MQPLIPFTFDSAKILSSTIRSREERPIEYTTTTVKKKTGPSQHSTALEGAPGTPDALIDWKRNTFAIAGSTRYISELRTKRATFSSSRFWSWFDCEEYKVKYESEQDNTWTMFSYSGSVLATFTSNIQRVFHKNSLPVLCMSPSVRDEDERRFIILVLLYSETKRLQSLKERPLVAVGAFLDNLPLPGS
ncbi:hypothetical protein C8R44DRAFT_987381 [Mycena epipterygia]|nr:hypothetical protein C8R44DRAFT_987381 [Mycena epipterygia]